MIIVSHIAKTGGSSFVVYLRQVFGARLFRDYPHLPPLQRSWWHRAWGWALGEPMGVPWNTRCIIGHFPAAKYDRAFPHARRAVWLRDPVERLVSNYHYLLAKPDPKNPDSRLLVDNKLSLAEFAALPRIRDKQARNLGRKPLATFDFVGITEHYDVSLQLFARVYAVPPPSAVPQVNCNPNRTGSRYPLEPDLREHLRRLNARDEALYQEGLERFASLCRIHDLQLPEEPRALSA